MPVPLLGHHILHVLLVAGGVHEVAAGGDVRGAAPARVQRHIRHLVQKGAGLRIRIRSDMLIFGLPDPVLFSLDPDPDPTCYNGFIKQFSS